MFICICYLFANTVCLLLAALRIVFLFWCVVVISCLRCRFRLVVICLLWLICVLVCGNLLATI